MKKERLLGPDIVRCLAILFVILLHSTVIFDLPGTVLENFKGFGYVFIRCFSLMCIPLFLLLTGYFQCTKTISKKFYKGIIPILTSYVFISIVTLFYLPYDKRPTFFGGIKGILNFTANPYSWYVEMYIGLFLLIPFLNVLYNGLKSKKQKLLLIGTLVFITGISDFFLSFGRHEENLFTTLKYWKSFYPISYYFIGCYIREYKPKIKKGINFLLLILLPCAVSLFFFAMCYKKPLNWYMFVGSANIIVVILSVTFFLFFYDLNFKNKVFKTVVTDISLRSFDMYLFSFIIDDMIQNYFLAKDIVVRKWYIVFGVLAVFISSYILAKIKQLLFYIIKCILEKINFKKTDIDKSIDKAS